MSERTVSSILRAIPRAAAPAVKPWCTCNEMKFARMEAWNCYEHGPCAEPELLIRLRAMPGPPAPTEVVS